MSNTKHLADMLKVCSILPALAIMPAMAGTGIIDTDAGGIFEYSTDSDLYTVISDGAVGSFSGYDASDRFEASVIFVGKGKWLSVADGSIIQDNKAQVGGALAITGNSAGATLHIGKDVKFLNNTALFDGGAIGNYGNTIVADGVLFQGNKAQLDPESNENQIGGGAISLGATSKTTMLNTNFIANESGYNGGAIATRLAKRTDGGFNDNSSAILKIVGGEFEGNKANGYKDASGKLVAGNGGAIYNTFYSDVTIDGTHFEGNKAAKYGGAIYNDGTADLKGKGGVMTINGGEFEENQASLANGYGGAIFNFFGDMSILGDENTRVVFEDNAAYVGGAFSDRQVSSSYAGLVSNTLIKHALFEENHAVADAGAAGFYGDVTVEDVIFRGNTAAIDFDGVKADVGNSDGGGAVQVGGTANVTLKDVYFAENESGARGGAIAARHGTKYTLDIDTATFTSNKSANFGGGIANVFGGAVDMNDVNFVSNYAGKAGGAIYNGKDINYGGTEGAYSTNHGILNFSGSNTFVGNRAEEFGGAIYNDNGGTINMSGTNVFADNTQSGIANDIYNLGALNIVSGETTFGGGVLGTGSLVLSEGAKLNIGTSVIKQNTIDLQGIVTASLLNDSERGGSFGRFVGNVEIGDNARFVLNVGAAGTYNVWNGAKVDASKVTVGDIYEIAGIDVNGVTIVTKSVEDIVEEVGVSTQAAGAVASLANSNSGKAHMVSLVLQEALNTGDIATVEAETQKLNPTDKPVAQAAATSVQNQVLSLAAGRMSGGAVMGRAGGDVRKQENGFWMQGLFNKSKLADQFHGYTRGVALGADTLIDDTWTIGGGLAFNNSDIHANTGHAEIDSKTLFVYGQYQPTKWYVNATATYTLSEYTENKNVVAAVWSNVYDVDSYGAQVMTGYDFATGITTEVGARYLHVAQDDYKDGLDWTSVMATETDFLSGVAGVKYAFAIENDWAVKLRPELRAAMTYDFISDNTATTVTMPGVEAYAVNGERLSRLGGEFGIGLTATYKGVDVSLMYDLDLHESYTSQTGMLKFRANF